MHGQRREIHPQRQYLSLKFGETAVLNPPPQMAQPDILPAKRAQFAVSLCSSFGQRQPLRRRQSQITVPLAGKRPALPQAVFVKRMNREVGVRESRNAVIRRERCERR